MRNNYSQRAQAELTYLLNSGLDSIVQDAFDFSEAAHEGQVRKHSGVPYIEHPIAVAYMVLRNIPSDHSFLATDMVCAALLHDVVEDTDHTIKEIRACFGTDIANLVEELTFPPFKEGTPREIKTMAKVGQFSCMSPTAKFIKLCDRLHNLTCAKEDNEKFFRRYARETEPMLYVAEGNKIFVPTRVLSKLWYIVNHVHDQGVEE